jgi:hypothetical protein
MYKKFFISILLALPLALSGQEAINAGKAFLHKNSFQAELFGHGLLYSINYERIIVNGQRFKTTGQLGMAYYPPSTGYIDIWIPLVFNELLSFNKHHIELGFGHIFTNEAIRLFDKAVYKREWGGFLTARLGYRYQKPQGRLIVRAGFTPIFEYRDFFEIHPSGGVSIGYSF